MSFNPGEKAVWGILYLQKMTGMWSRDLATELSFDAGGSAIIWRPVNYTGGMSGLSPYKGEVELRNWFQDNMTAVGCWRDSPENCGTMYNFQPQCADWLVSHFLSPEDGWMHGPGFTPNGTLYAISPDGQDTLHGEWILELGDETIKYCISQLPADQEPNKAWLANSGPDFRWDGNEWNALEVPDDVVGLTDLDHGPFDHTYGNPGGPEIYKPLMECFVDDHFEQVEYQNEEEVDPCANVHPYKRSAAHSTGHFTTDFETLLTVLPSADSKAVDEYVGRAAGLVHKHMGRSNHSADHSKLLYKAMSKVMGTTKRRSGPLSMIKNRGLVRTDALARAFHEKLLDTTPHKHDRKRIDALATGALAKAARERLVDGTWSWGMEDFIVMDYLFNRIHRQSHDEL